MSTFILVLVGAVSPETLDRRLTDPQPDAWFSFSAAESRLGRPAVAAYLLVDRGHPLGDVRRSVQALGGMVHGTIESLHGLVIEIPPSSLSPLAQGPGVRWIEPALPPWQATNDESRGSIGVDEIYGSPWFLDGTGVELGMIEIGQPDPNHADLSGRITGFCGADGHATHVAGTLIGDGSESGGTYRGIAPNATLQSRCISFDGSGVIFFADPSSLETAYTTMLLTGTPSAVNQSMGINIAANGYDCALMGDYGVTSALMDEVVRGSLGQPLSSVWSAGNERGFSVCDGDYGTVSPPACAKNIITVGAVYSDSLTVTSFSGFGPTDDGRIKPDVVAAGGQLTVDGGITSCKSGGGYEVRSGTSMSAPVVTGVIGLMRQAWDEVSPAGATPPLPSTMRGLLCHTALDLGEPGPDYRTGWGLVDAEMAAEAVLFTQWTEGSIGPSEARVFSIERGSDQAGTPLRISLAWDDPASFPGEVVGLINDLDLLLRSPSGVVYRPWTLDPLQPEAAAVRTGVDNLNTFEQVLVDQAEAGVWDIVVLSPSDLDGVQSFSLLGVGENTGSQTFLSFEALPADYPIQESLGVTVTIGTINDEVIPGSVTIAHRLNGGGFTETPMQPVGTNGRYAAILPAVDCGTTVEFYVRIETTVAGVQFLPAGGPADPEQLTAVASPTQTYAADFTVDEGWAFEAGAATGNWEISQTDPCWPDVGTVWALHTDGEAFCEVLSNGTSRAVSPPITLNGPDAVLFYERVMYSSCNDQLTVDISADGSTWIVLEEESGSIPSERREVSLAAVPGLLPAASVRLRFSITSGDFLGCADGFVTGVELVDVPCGPVTNCPGDIAQADGGLGPDGVVGVDDILLVLMNYGLGGPTGDLDEDGDVDVVDLLLIIGFFGPCP